MSFYSEESLEEANQYRLQEMLSGETISEGENKWVILSPRNSVFKVHKNDAQVQGDNSDLGRHKWQNNTIGEISDNGEEIESLRWAYKDSQSYNTLQKADEETSSETPPWLENMRPGEEVQIIGMKKAPISHGQAVEELGLQEVISRDVAMFQDILQTDFEVFFDFKHQNTGYFWDDENQGEMSPSPIDLYDRDAFTELDDGSSQIARSMGLYLRGNEAYSGVADEYGVPLQEAEAYVFDALGLNPGRANGKPYKDLMNTLG